jgi:hypothetical protein
LGSPIVEAPILYRVLTQNSRLQRKDSTNTGTLAREHLSVIICAELYAALCHCVFINLLLVINVKSFDIVSRRYLRIKYVVPVSESIYRYLPEVR